VLTGDGGESTSIPNICHWITGRRLPSLKRMKNKISEYGSSITKTVYYEVSCGVVVCWVQKGTVDRGSDPVVFCLPPLRR